MASAVKPSNDPRNRKRGRDIALFVALIAFVVLVYAISIVRMGAQ